MVTKRTITMYYKFTATILISLCLSEIMTGQPFSEKRTFMKSVSVNRETTLEISNKYGNIHITPGNSDSVTISVDVEAVASNQDRPAKMLKGIDINITETSFLVRAETQFSQNINLLFESFKGMTHKLIPYDSKIQINYFITVPEFLNIRIINKYGDVYMENNTGNFSLDLSNGSFKANSLEKTARIKMNFCNATINSINDGYFDASFSDVVIGGSKNLIITSISSRFDLKKAGNIDTRSRRDKFYIGTAGSVKGNSYFTDYRIDELDRELNIVSKYGTISVDHIGKSIEMINLNSGYTDIYLTFDPSASYNLDIRHTNTFLTLPGQNIKVEKKSINEEKKEYATFGTIGRNPGNVKVQIDANRGNIHIK